MKKNLLRIAMSVMLMMSAMQCWAGVIASGTCGEDGDNLTWSLSDDYVLTISGSGEMDNYNPEIGNSPWYIFRYAIKKIVFSGVTSIGEYAFEGCSSLTSVTIPSNVASIGYYAFSGCYLKEIINNSALDAEAYSNWGACVCDITDDGLCIYENIAVSCSKYATSVNIPNSVTSIGSGVFEDCSILASVTIPSSVTSIGGGAFSGCRSLTGLTIPSSVTSIGNGAFSGCSSLTSIMIPNSVTSIGERTFRDCSCLTSVTIPSSVKSIGSYALYGCRSLISVTIPTSVKSIGSFAFGYCRSLTSVTIPNSVTSINDYVFYGCSSLTSVTIPSSVASIGYSAFYGCSSLTGVTIPSSVASIADNAFTGCSSLTSVTIPSRVTSICSEVFRNCSSLTSVTIPSSVTSIGSDAFYGCSSLPVINGIRYADTYLVEAVDKENLTTSNIAEGTRFINSSAFSNCSSLTKVTIPSSVKNIGYMAFGGCFVSEFTNNSTLNAETNNYWGAYVGDIADNGLYIKNDIVVGCKKDATCVTIPDSVKSIGENAFRDCSRLTSVTIPSSVTSIGYYAFSGCSSLTSVTIPSSVTSVGYGAFSDCYLREFNNNSSINAEVNKYWGACVGDLTADGLCINENVVVGCKKDAIYVTIPNGVASIGERAFYGCSSLTSVTMPNSVTSIGNYAFSNCSSLSSMTIPNSVTSVGERAFQGCSNLHSVHLPESVRVIKEATFANCSSLESVTMLGVTSIDGFAFSGCSSLKVLRMPQISSLECGWLVEIIEGNLSPFEYYRLSSVYCGKVPFVSFDYGECYFETYAHMYMPYVPIVENGGILYVPRGSKKVYSAHSYFSSRYPIIEEYDIDDPYALYDNAIYIEDSQVRTTSTVSLPIKMKNKVAAKGFEFSLVLPKEINANDVVLKKSSARKADEVSFRSAVQADGSIKVVCYTTDGQAFDGNDGEVATLTMTIPAEMADGKYDIIIKDVEISDNGTPVVLVDQFVASLTVESYLLGDANRDNRVSVSDLSVIVNHILNVDIAPEDPYNAKAADANEDERISVSDLSSIVNIILYGNPDGPSEGKARDEEDAQSFLFSAPTLTINPGEESTLYLQLANSVDVTAFQFDAILPEGLSCSQAKRVTARVGEEHSFQTSQMDEQTRRVVCYSSTNANIEGNEGAIVELTIKAADNLQPALYTLSLEGLEVVSHNQGMTLDNVALSIEVVDADGIEVLQQDQTVKTRYDLMGRSTVRPQHGIYFENGRKVLVK